MARQREVLFPDKFYHIYKHADGNNLNPSVLSDPTGFSINQPVG